MRVFENSVSDESNDKQVKIYLIKIEEVAKMLNVKVSTIRAWVFEKKIPYYKIGSGKGGLIRFNYFEIVALLESMHHLAENECIALSNNIVRTKQWLMANKVGESFESYIKKLWENHKNANI